jgi:hypothetical protein
VFTCAFFRLLLLYGFRVLQDLVLIAELLSIFDGLVKKPLKGHLVKNADGGIARIQKAKT